MQDKIEKLLLTGIKANVQLAVELAKGQEVALDEYLEFAKLSRARSDDPIEQLYDFFNKAMVSLERKGLKALPEWLFRHKATFFYLGGNELKELPENLPKRAIEELCLENNYLRNLPPSFSNLEIDFLDLSGNRFIDCPSVIFELKSLRELDLGANKLEVLPEEIAELAQLEKLSLSQNVLKELPESMQWMPNLTSLDLSDNALERYPAELDRLIIGSLKKMNLSRNQLSKFPEDIRKWADQLELVVFRGNPISEEDKVALVAEEFFQLNSLGWELLDEKDFYEEL